MSSQGTALSESEIKSLCYNAESVVSYFYDALWRLEQVTDTKGPTINYAYDRIGRVTAVTTDSQTVGYDYDNLDRRTKLTYPDSSEVSYEYDALSRLDKVFYNGAQVADYDYDELSRRTLATYNNNTTAVYQYDIGDRLTRITNNLNGSTVDVQYSNYDKVGNRLNMLVNGNEDQYLYDELYRLIFVDYHSGADTSYLYDALDNWLETDNGSVTSFSHNELNQYTSVASATYTYDAKGNLTYDATYTYIYDCENRLTGVKQGATTIATYGYDYLGRRTSKTVSGVTTKYSYSGNQIIAEYDGSNNLLRKYVYGPGIDEPICMIDVAGGNVVYYYHFDGLGSVVALSNNSGNVVEQYSYNVFGTPSTTSSVGNPYLFTARRYDSETGLYYCRARYYKPSIGRFLQTDPSGYADSMNLYQYCGNNPINFFDPYGLDKFDSAVNFCAGAGDVLSFGVTRLARKVFSGVFSKVNYNSTAYKAGEWTGVGISVATGVAGGIKAAGVKSATTEFSHWIPTRYGGPRSLLNGNFVTPARHYLQDGYRYIKGWEKLGRRLPQVLRQIDRVPNLYKWFVGGLGAGVVGKTVNDNIDSDSADDSEINGNTSMKRS